MCGGRLSKCLRKEEQMSKKQKVVIIGAGPAGLTAGLELLRQSKD